MGRGKKRYWERPNCRDCAQELCAVREERDRQKKQADIGLRELTKRADRIKLLERQRNELQERLQHMEFQVWDMAVVIIIGLIPIL